MIVLKVLLAELSVDESLPTKRVIAVKLGNHIEGVEIHVEVVTTLRAVMAMANDVNVTILDLHLEDAGPDAIIAAIPYLPEPVIIMTDIIDTSIHARCRMAGASILVKNLTRNNELCSVILHCLGKSVANSVNRLPQ